MTTEEAIRWIAAIKEKYIHGGYEWFDKMRGDALDMALAALRAQVEAEKHAPLTLEELREMDGKPVWVNCLNNPAMSCWGFMDNGSVIGYHMNFFSDNFGVTWLAYRRKPEEAPC